MNRQIIGAALIFWAVAETHAQNYATQVIGYQPGTGGTAGYTNSASALGVPSVVTADPTFGTSPVDPFSPPYLKDQLVSLGAGGSLTLKVGSPIQNLGSNPFGIDFMVFGNAGFVITNNDFGGGGITDGSMFGGNEGTTRVSVSSDGATYYTLNPSLAPVFDALLPTDGLGNPFLGANPSLTAASFSGKSLTGIRTLYGASAGGTGYDLAWAVDGTGKPVNLSSASFVRLEVLSGHAEVDALTVVPEPGVLILGLTGAALLAGLRREKAKSMRG